MWVPSVHSRLVKKVPPRKRTGEASGSAPSTIFYFGTDFGHLLESILGAAVLQSWLMSFLMELQGIYGSIGNILLLLRQQVAAGSFGSNTTHFSTRQKCQNRQSLTHDSYMY